MAMAPVEKRMRDKRFQIIATGRKSAQIEATIAKLDQLASALDADIEAEQLRTGIQDPTHFAYSTYAKATMLRRDNLRCSADGLRKQLNILNSNVTEMIADLSRLERRKDQEQREDHKPMQTIIATAQAMQ